MSLFDAILKSIEPSDIKEIERKAIVRMFQDEVEVKPYMVTHHTQEEVDKIKKIVQLERVIEKDQLTPDELETITNQINQLKNEKHR